MSSEPVVGQAQEISGKGGNRRGMRWYAFVGEASRKVRVQKGSGDLTVDDRRQLMEPIAQA
ncbi:hypothetical protein ACFVOK_34150 [Streptomyces sp. NPDC057798]|uniref:hypothetical protein n=1 Tax=Streptomyces sp. NPDC057798 TaxID=3346252 RepID=UPI0036CB2E54